MVSYVQDTSTTDLFLPVAMLFIGFFENTQNAYFTSICINAVIYGALTYIISKQVSQ